MDFVYVYTPNIRGYSNCLSGKIDQRATLLCPLKKDHILHLTICDVITVCNITTYFIKESGIVDGRK
ncbi:uncharacterized protein Bfra_003061 [Botrytis fragariae]|uniref:Uncharacterized protein n=1 Tax=Botrytis fragariae TaxID=1964551 RepID=A0A8H6B041_9HELO|nr:uncharacterized protein Bfra_003061 [Botrytis fragariae]KAF5876655.1 hypothetical protein Bfra_003061 [Botrytis fragariae]